MLFCARVDSAAAGGVHGLPEENEDIRVVVKTLAEIEALLEGGAIESGHTLIGLYWLLRHRDRLRRLWADGESPSPQPSPRLRRNGEGGPAQREGEGQQAIAV